MSEDTVLYREDGLVGVITLNRPDVLNAFDHAMVTRLARAPRPGARVRHARDRHHRFGPGVLLADMTSPSRPLTASEPVGNVHGYMWEIQRLTTRIVEHPAIVIAALNGPAVGMAAELCVAADLRLVSEEAYLLFPEVRLALLETNGVTWLLPRAVGHARASDWLLTCRRIRAPGARHRGFCEPPGGARRAAARGARDGARDRGLGAALDPAGQAHAASRVGWRPAREPARGNRRRGRRPRGAPTSIEGMRAFHEKRVPRYTGE